MLAGAAEGAVYTGMLTEVLQASRMSGAAGPSAISRQPCGPA